jgi:RNA polymerase sigma-70 factor (ECF subfamily)
MSDKEMVTAFLRDRSEDNFRRLYRHHTPQLYRSALRLSGGDVPSAEDIIQEMWCIAIRKLPEFEWRSELRSWLTGILVNLSRQHARLHRRDAVEAATNPKFHEPLNVQVMDLERAIAALPDGYRQVVILHDVEGFKHAEIAGMLDISEGTSKSQLSHARKSLREMLSR